MLFEEEYKLEHFKHMSMLMEWALNFQFDERRPDYPLQEGGVVVYYGGMPQEKFTELKEAAYWLLRVYKSRKYTGIPIPDKPSRDSLLNLCAYAEDSYNKLLTGLDGLDSSVIKTAQTRMTKSNLYALERLRAMVNAGVFDEVELVEAEETNA